MRKKKTIMLIFLLVYLISVFTINACAEKKVITEHNNIKNRKDVIPSDMMKRGPENNLYPPILHSSNYEEPVPLPGCVNSSGAEDSAFILPDGNTLYFFFTPDARIPPEEQLFDCVTGIWVSQKVNGLWSEPERIWLQEPGKLAIDGAVCVQGDEMWFASAREGFEGVNMFTAIITEGGWTKWEYAGDRLMKELQIGEVHIHKDDLYFHSARPGGKGDYDIWVTSRAGGSWSEPDNIESINTCAMEGFPFVSYYGKELWFTRTYLGTPAIFRSLNIDGKWNEPELIISQFAAEPTLDNNGNIYFIHHYFENNIMVEADIYVSYKK